MNILASVFLDEIIVYFHEAHCKMLITFIIQVNIGKFLAQLIIIFINF